MDETTLNNIILATVTVSGAVGTAFWVAFIIWTYNDMKARSRDPLAQIAAALMVAVLNVFGLIIYVMLRPRETLADAYERSLEEEALLQEIEEKPACPGCGRPTKHEWQVCPYCHTKLKKPCINCGQHLELSWNLCPHCAVPQVQREAVSAGEPSESINAGQQPQRSAPQKSPYDIGDYAQNENIEWVDDSNY